MKVFIANSGPIISFARAGFLDLLQGVLGELWIPGAVYEDIVVKGKPLPDNPLFFDQPAVGEIEPVKPPVQVMHKCCHIEGTPIFHYSKSHNLKAFRP